MSVREANEESYWTVLKRVTLDGQSGPFHSRTLRPFVSQVVKICMFQQVGIRRRHRSLCCPKCTAKLLLDAQHFFMQYHNDASNHVFGLLYELRETKRGGKCARIPPVNPKLEDCVTCRQD